MKWFAFILLVFFLSKDGYMSGESENIELKSRLHKQCHVYLVKIIGRSTVKIKEIKNRVKRPDSTAANHTYYSAKVLEIINKGCESSDEKERWTMLFSPTEKLILQKTRKNGAENIAVNDTILIMDGDDLSKSYTYYVEGLHKIFIYYHCADAAGSIETGSTYLFISDGDVSKKSGVFYGNIDYGLYPDTREMRKKIGDILADRNN